MPTKELHTASEIAAMRLPGMPTSKSKIIDKALSEGWPYEEKKGRGGTSKAYNVPKKYFLGDDASVVPQPDRLKPGKVVATIAGGRVDPNLLETVIRVMDEWVIEHDVAWKPDRKAMVTVLLYDYIDKGATPEDVTRLLQAVK